MSKGLHEDREGRGYLRSGGCDIRCGGRHMVKIWVICQGFTFVLHRFEGICYTIENIINP